MFRNLSFCFGLAIICSLPSVSLAELAKITDKAQFVEIVNGKTLSRPLVRLEVTPDGKIAGTGATFPIEGSWKWDSGFFCRDLIWGGDSLGYNCQEVRVNGSSIRFTADRGNGDYADFRIR
ncbi:dihydrodipicolinate reductase [Parasulfitobacter algicola]|uniref:Dihydrodipicolinate reductase n=1 Tax=Parasulfitobacter algicola TaxID=2614809 RepID=A0ABX2ISL9_9RHOB|nr:dihydrodipicolinate reductase [Sulfitobacter algicola]NSX54070.1 dihydrodipicolinate reductase [Sulfitobacter algicola]